MASEAPSSTALPAPEAPSDHLSVNLQVLSPSTAASSSRPLVFPGLSASTTVRQLKEKIRQSLPLKPTDAQQRLIYRGRPLQQDGDTLLNVIGEEVIRNTDQQTIHLVLRDVAETHRSTTPTPALARGSSPAPPIAQFHVPVNAGGQPHHAHHHGSQPTAAAFTRRTPLNPTSNPLPFPTPSQIPSNLTPQQIQQMQAQQHQSMAAWMNGIHREAMNRAMASQQINQNQSMRASLGLHGIGDPNAPANPADPTRGRVSPANPDAHTYVREGVMPNGQPYRVTVNETVIGGSLNVHGQGGTAPLSASEVHNILRGADAGQATLAMTNAMRRSASNTSLANGSVGVTTPYYPTPGSRASSRRATPDPTARSVSGGSGHSASMQRQSPSGPEVYILNSPQGPRAILMNNNSETYYTPTVRHQPLPFYNPAQATTGLRRRTQWVPFPNPAVPQDEQQPAQPAEPAQAQPQPEVQPQGQPPIAAVPAHPNNPGIAPLIAQVWPHFWLIVRLGLFVWWFTSPNASWSRWFAVVFIALSIFVLNTGLLNGFFDQAVGPVRRHMENLIPLAAPNNPNEPVRPRQGQDVIGANGQPDPARAAARLVDQRRHDNGNWLMDQVRRLERAGLLFLASIAPGVAERHIAHLEAEARAERQRREEAEAAAAAAAAEAANAQNTENQNEETTETGGNDSENQTQETQGEQPREEQQQQHQPLVAI
ncbi:ubiquitin family protein [Colletotrichum karsti]|uniref:Ubiquitin family protein n=1 Tax=Colletotrichum karsti TaxID=1095194 RepID=A0A9P6LD46_9PEZI|nr:ubiquitin family protein [Colletotrichum karsti]KAF9870794.1 ubiquitin family protein [Colletotrichum karsti]